MCKKKGEGNRKNGNSYLASAFVEAAHYALRYSTAAKRFYDRKRAHSNTALATKALAHKLARARYHMLKGKSNSTKNAASRNDQGGTGEPAMGLVISQGI